METLALERLYKILSMNRAHLSPGVQHFYEEILFPYGPTAFYGAKDEVLAWGIQVGEGSRSLFLAHSDTCEKWDGQLTRPISVDEKNFVHSDGVHVLGADCGSGVAILLHMIDNSVPGYYCVTVGEECGGAGVKGLVAHHAEFFSQFDRAISFDRKATYSVITHMWNGRTCSDEFAEAMCDALTGEDLMFSPDSTGSYTDSCDLTGLISCCTNISSGYALEHTVNETLDLTYLQALAERVTQIDWEALPVKRAKGEVDPDDMPAWGASSFGSFIDYTNDYPNDYPESWEDLGDITYLDLVKWVKKADPREVAAMMADMFDEISFNASPEFEEPVFDEDEIEGYPRLKSGMF